MNIDLDLPLQGNLQLGSRGFPVLRLQRRLNELHAITGPHAARLRTDGAYGLRTVAAVRAWQAHERLPTHGAVERRTALSLGFTRFVHTASHRTAPLKRHEGRLLVASATPGPLDDLAQALARAVGLVMHTVRQLLEPVKALMVTLWGPVERMLVAAQAHALTALAQLQRWVGPRVAPVEAMLRQITARLARDLAAALAFLARQFEPLAAALAHMGGRIAQALTQVRRAIEAVLRGAGGWADQIVAAATHALRALRAGLPAWPTLPATFVPQ